MAFISIQVRCRLVILLVALALSIIAAAPRTVADDKTSAARPNFNARILAAYQNLPEPNQSGTLHRSIPMLAAFKEDTFYSNPERTARVEELYMLYTQEIFEEFKLELPLPDGPRPRARIIAENTRRWLLDDKTSPPAWQDTGGIADAGEYYNTCDAQMGTSIENAARYLYIFDADISARVVRQFCMLRPLWIRQLSEKDLNRLVLIAEYTDNGDELLWMLFKNTEKIDCKAILTAYHSRQECDDSVNDLIAWGCGPPNKKWKPLLLECTEDLLQKGRGNEAFLKLLKERAEKDDYVVPG